MIANEWQARAKWERALASGVDGTYELDPAHPLRCVYGLISGAPTFLLITDFTPQVPLLSTAVKVSRSRRAIDQKWVLEFSLLDEGVRVAFMDLCIELARRSSSADDQQSALEQVYQAIRELRSLLSIVSRIKLGPSAAAGIFGELYVFGRLCDKYSSSEVVKSWSGPFGAPKDFLFDAGVAVEVKAVGPQAKRIQISSMEQLDISAVESMMLEVVTVVESQRGCDLGTLIEQTRLRFDCARDVALFDVAMARLANPEQLSELKHLRFAVTRRRTYAVREHFPRITRDGIHLAIVNARYDLNLDGLAPWCQFDESEHDGTV